MIYSIKAVREAAEQIRATTPLSKMDEAERQLYHALAVSGAALEWSA